MPGLAQRQPGNATAAAAAAAAASSSCSPAAVGSGALWSNRRHDVDFDQLQKFWCGLLPRARRELLRIDKHTLFEQARKNLYCSRCNGLLLEGFSQIVMYGKSLQQEGGGVSSSAGVAGHVEDESDEAVDPSVHPWGGLMASRDGILTLKDCYLRGNSLWVLHNVFDSARIRERERELLYPDACGGGGRGWISHGIATYGRLHGGRETCALHTARLSCDTLVDFWSALGDETRLSLFRMKEEDFIERLMYRFDSKRFCRDCRKNVIREFKELKELKRMRRETRCTTWFCAADSAFHYEVSRDKVLANWHQSFVDSASTYHHYEWAIGSGEGKSDILAFEDVGMTMEVLADGLELGVLDACYITLRACRLDGRYTEVCVKAHALKGKSCVHQRLVVGDGFVTITKGESVRSFFDHAEEAEEEEEDDVTDKDGNDLDSEGSRPQKHAKSPELAREFLLDAATIIFKGQVEKAFREGTARQNAHSLFVCLALKLLEERLHVACKEIITFEKQVKLLEEEEREKREEGERRERRRLKEREKKLRRKERLREKEREKERKDGEADQLSTNGVSSCSQEVQPVVLDENGPHDEVEEPILVTCTSLEDHPDQHSDGFIGSKSENLPHCTIDGEADGESSDSFIPEQSRSCRRRLRSDPDPFVEHVFEWSRKDRYTKDDEHNGQNGGSDSKSSGYGVASSKGNSVSHKFSRESFSKTTARNPTLRFEKLIHASNRSRRSDCHSCSCNQVSSYRGKDSQFATRSLHQNRQNNRICAIDVPATSKEKPGPVKSSIGRDVYKKQVWEPTDSRKKGPRNDMEATTAPRTSTANSLEQNENGGIQNCHESLQDFQAPSKPSPPEHDPQESNKPSLSEEDSSKSSNLEDCKKEAHGPTTEGDPVVCSDDFGLGSKPYSKADDDEVDSSASPTSPLNNGCDSTVSSSSSDNCSSCISETDSSSSSTAARNPESSSVSDSEDVSQQFEGREMPTSRSNDYLAPQDNKNSVEEAPFGGNASMGTQSDNCPDSKISGDERTRGICEPNISQMGNGVESQWQHMLPLHNHGMHSAYVSFPTVGYCNEQPTSWSAAVDHGMMPFPRTHPYMLSRPLHYSVGARQPSDFYVNCSGLRPLTSPVLRVNQSPVAQNVEQQINTFNPNEQVRNPGMVRSKDRSFVDAIKFLPCAEGSSSSEKRCHSESSSSSSTRENRNTGKCGKMQKEALSSSSSPFSLFHFNGPVALASGNSLESSPPQSETVLDDDSKQNLPKKETIVEEYSLFASTSGSRISFF